MVLFSLGHDKHIYVINLNEKLVIESDIEAYVKLFGILIYMLFFYLH